MLVFHVTIGCQQERTLTLAQTLVCSTTHACYPGSSQAMIDAAGSCKGERSFSAHATSKCGLTADGTPQAQRYCNPWETTNCTGLCEGVVAAPFPPENVFDGLDTTWWQAVPGKENVSLTVVFPRVFLLTETLMTFRNYRPWKMSLLGSSNGGATWRTLQYYADECRFPESLGGFSLPRSKDGDLIGNLDVHCTESAIFPENKGMVRY